MNVYDFDGTIFSSDCAIGFCIWCMNRHPKLWFTFAPKAIRNGIYGCYVEFEKLHPLIQKVVGDPQQINSWAQLTEGINTVVASNFMRNYRTELERMRMDAAIPKEVKAVLEQHGIGRASSADVYTSTLSGHGPGGTGPASNAPVRTNFRELPDTPQEREV